MLRPGRGMYWDVRRRLPYYMSDIKDGCNYRTIAGTIRIYFVKYVQGISEIEAQRLTNIPVYSQH